MLYEVITDLGLAPGRFDQDSPHRGGGGGKEVNPVAPRRLVAGQPDERLVDQGGGLQGMTAPLVGQAAAGHALELVVDQRHELVASYNFV